MDLKEEQILGDAIDEHWYYRAKARALERMLPARFNRVIVDVGAGSGFFSNYLARRGLIDEAVCIDVGYQSERREQVAGASILYTPKAEFHAAGAALFMDVLEHVEDDAGLLRMYRDLLPREVQLIITVPAFSFIWSGHDVFLGHHRRYSIKSLCGTLERAGYSLLGAHYLYGLLFPAALIDRLVAPGRLEPRSRLKRHGPVTNAILSAACSMEIPFMRYNRAVGLSVCATCRPA